MYRGSFGYSALIERFGLQVPPLRQTFVGGSGSAIRIIQAPDGIERVELPKSQSAQKEGVVELLTFALKREHLNLAVLGALFERPGVLDDVQAWLKAKPLSKYARQAGYLAHWVADAQFDYTLPAGAPRIPLLDPKKYVVGPSTPNPQFGIVNNLLGAKSLSPLVRRTKLLQQYLVEDMAGSVQRAIAALDPELLHRAADYLYLSETRSTYGIEDEVPDNNRAAKFRRVLESAGELGALSETQFWQWQNQIVSPLSAEYGYRKSQNWLSRPGRLRGIADYIPPTEKQVPLMMQGIEALRQQTQQGSIHPVIGAACAAFGFVFIHPFLDGNGRLHRFLIHHILRQCGFTPPGVVLPISARMLKQLPRYFALLKSYSAARTALLNYLLDSDSGTILVKSVQPAWLYAYFDATELCEFLMECCKSCVEEDLMREVQYLRAHDLTVKELESWLDMRQSQLNTLIDVVVQGHGSLSKRKHNLVQGYSQDQIAKIEEVVSRHFADYIDAKA